MTRPIATLIFACRDDDPLVDAFLRRLAGRGIDVSRVAEDLDPLVSASSDGHVILGGFSRGARLAVAAAERVTPAGLLLLGYPFHPKGEPTQLAARDRLAAVRVPTLVLQGERDAYGNRQRIGDVAPHITLHWVQDGNHRFVPRQGSGVDPEALLDAAADHAATFILAKS